MNQQFTQEHTLMLYNPNWKSQQAAQHVSEGKSRRRRSARRLPRPVLDETSQTLVRAADHIEQHGWCRYHHEKADGSVCIAGAIRRVGGAQIQPARVRLQEHLKMSLVEWNDSTCETKDQAIAMLRKVARQSVLP